MCVIGCYVHYLATSTRCNFQEETKGLQENMMLRVHNGSPFSSCLLQVSSERIHQNEHQLL